METIIFNKTNLKEASDLIKEGKTVVFPTETVYGLGANALSDDAVKKIFEAKGRPSDNPLIVHISNKEQLYEVGENISENAKILSEKFMPGPITLVVNKKDIIPASVSAGLTTVGVRCPKNEIAREFISLCGVPVAAPSANISGSVSATSFCDVKDELMGRVSGIIQGDDCYFGIESTVVDVTKKAPVILRPGSVTLEMIKEVIPTATLHPSLINKSVIDMEKAPPSPGMKYKHYAPKAQVYLVYGEFSEIKKWFLKQDNEKKCLFIFDKYIDKTEKNVYDIGSEENFSQMASLIFKYMKKADKDGFDTIYIPAVKEEGIGFSIMNRLKKSSGGKTVVL